MLDLQKASILKRISAYILDFIVLVICITGFSLVLSLLLGYDSHSEALENRKEEIAKEYDVDFDITEEEFLSLDEEKKELYNKANEAFSSDESAQKEWSILINLMLTILTFSILMAYVLTEFVVPMILKNGQTIGKKVFSLAVMRTNHVRLSNRNLFIRTILGKYTMETMFPVMIFLMSFIGILGIVGILVILLLVVFQICLLIFTKNNCTIHDILSDTVVVDLSSQMIFQSEDDLLEYQKSCHDEKVKNFNY